MADRQIIVRVPGTTANLGPGFDTLGIALSLYNWVTVALDQRVQPQNRMMREAVAAFFRAIRRKPHTAAVSVTGDVPISRGLGSSVTVRLGIVAGLNRLHGSPLSRAELLALVARLEGHPDNAAPALLGGFVASATLGAEIRTCRAEVSPRLRFATVIPELEIETEHARKVLPARVTLRDAVSNVNRAALITGAFATGRYGDLRGAFGDALHQPYRQKLLPPLFDVIRAGEKAGALGGWLSGSGSTIVCATLTHPGRVGLAMKRVLEEKGIRSQMKVLVASNRGVVFGKRGTAKKP